MVIPPDAVTDTRALPKAKILCDNINTGSSLEGKYQSNHIDKR